MTEMTMEEEYGPKIMPPIHPGEILNEEFLIPMNLTPGYIAKAIGIEARQIQAIVDGQEPIYAEIALLFSRFFGNSPEFWMRLQDGYDLEMAEDRLADRLNAVVAYSPEG